MEEDLTSAELEVVPAEPARDVGLDRGIVGAYGQDDRVSAFCSLRAGLDVPPAKKNILLLFFDKEEIGSEGNTSARAQILESFLERLFSLKKEPFSRKVLVRTLAETRALSADVAGALDPDYQEVHEKRNAPRMGYGVCLTKLPVRGEIRFQRCPCRIPVLGAKPFNHQEVIWQTGELGKVDEGGGGTIAKFLAALGMDILDCGTPVLVHAFPL